MADNVFALFPLPAHTRAAKPRALPRGHMGCENRHREREDRTGTDGEPVPRIALRNAESVLQAGLRARERVSPDLRLPVQSHSGGEQILDSLTVAGAAPALLREERTGFPFNPSGEDPRDTCSV